MKLWGLLASLLRIRPNTEPLRPIITDRRPLTRCTCGRTAKNNQAQCGPCLRGERICTPLGGEPVGGG